MTERNRFLILGTIATLAALLLAVTLLPGCSSDKSKSGSVTDSSNGSTPADSGDSSAPVEVEQPQSSAPSQTASRSEQAVEQAKTEGKPVLLCFHSLKCAPCIQIEENINQVKPEYEGKVAFVIVDVYDPSEYNFCIEYDIETIPTTVFIKKDGTIAKGYIGVLEPNQLKKELDALL